MTKISKVLIIVATFFAVAMVYTDSGYALNSDSDGAISSNDILIDPGLIEITVTEEYIQDNDESPLVFVDGTGDFEQEIPEQINPEIGTPEFEQAAQEAAEKAAQEAGESNFSAASLAELVSLQDTNDALSSEMQCLAGTVYFESKGESLAGQLAVAKVVLARKESSRFPNSICGVVYQRKQFSFVRGGRMPKIHTNRKTWRNAVAIAKIAQNDQWDSKVEGALFFHATYISPGWKRKRLGRIDRHIFYK